MANAVIYARYSSHNQREESIEDQVRICRAEAKRNGDRIVHVYHDSAKSGTETTKRREFLRMMKDSERRKWSKVYVYKLDRFARDVYDANVNRRKLEEQGVSVVSATEPMGDGPEAIILRSVLEGFAQFNSMKMSVEIRRGLEGNALQCRHNGVWVYGYDLGDDGTYIVNESEARVVRDAFALYDSGISVNDIAIELNDRGYRTKRGNRWSTQQVAKMLKNEKYVGVYKFAEIRVEDGMPAIVDRALFDRVNATIGRRRRRGHSYPLSGKLYDADGRKLVGTSATGKRGKRYNYYWVPGTARRLPQEALEACVCAAVSDFLTWPGVTDYVVSGLLKARDRMMADQPDAVADLRERLAELDREADRLVDLAMRTAASDRIARKIDEIEDERAGIAASLAEAEALVPRIDEDLIRFFVDQIVNCKAPDDVVAQFVSRIVIDGDHMDVTFSLDGCSHWMETGPNDSENPSEPAGGEGCSHRYSLVEMLRPDTNTTVIFGVIFFTFSARLSL